MAGPGDTRIGAAERDAALQALGDHLVAGRLLPAEYEERAGAAAGARTRADLRPLFDDLPPPHPPYLGDPAGPGAGRLPADLRATLAAEGLRILVEDLAGTITYRRFRAPGQGLRLRRRDVPVSGAVAVSGHRLVVWVAGSKQVDVPRCGAVEPDGMESRGVARCSRR